MILEKIPQKTRKVLNIVLNVCTYVFFSLCLLALILSVSAKRDADGAVNLFGKQMRIVVSDSMEKNDQTDVSDYKIKSIPLRSLIFIELVPTDQAEADKWYSELKKGDVLTFRYLYVTQETITHRITRDPIPKSDGGYIIYLEGDNKAADANTLSQVIDTSQTDSPNHVIGKVTGQSRFLGGLISVVKSTVGIICIIIIPCVIIAIFEVIRLVGLLGENKRKAEQEAKQKRDQEFEEMKRKLEQLQQQNNLQNPTEETKE